MKIRISKHLVFCAALTAAPMFAATCESLANLKLPSTTITAAKTVAAGAFALPPGIPPAPPGLGGPNLKTVPAFCRVEGVIQPSSDSHIEFEVWLPASGWNHKYLGVGNGGFAGSIAYTVPPRATLLGWRRRWPSATRLPRPIRDTRVE